MLVDLARNDLGRVCVPGSVTVPDYAIIERYSHVMHIVSQVEGNLAPQHDAFEKRERDHDDARWGGAAPSRRHTGSARAPVTARPVRRWTS